MDASVSRFASLSVLNDDVTNRLSSADISGVPGAGKTATVHPVVRELKRMAEQNVCFSSAFERVEPTRRLFRVGDEPVHIRRDKRFADTGAKRSIWSTLGGNLRTRYCDRWTSALQLKGSIETLIASLWVASAYRTCQPCLVSVDLFFGDCASFTEVGYSVV